MAGEKLTSPTVYSFLLILIWRKKMLIFVCSIACLVGIWAWAIFYTAFNSRSPSESKRIMSLLDFDAYPDHLVARYAKNSQIVKYQKPERPIRDDGTANEPPKIAERFQRFKSFFLNGDAERIMDTSLTANVDNRQKEEMRRTAANLQRNYEHKLQKMGIPVVPGLGPKGLAPPSQRLVHLDLKGAPPKISYLKRLLPIIKSLGATGVLIEYEDMFPYTGAIDQISARNAYTKSDIRDLLHNIALTGLTVMPLVQTFGHLEFALKLREFQSLREVPESPQSVCPSFNESMTFLHTMIAQMVQMHMPDGEATESSHNEIKLPAFTHLHIGCDEVYRMGECARCKNRDRNEIFLSHVRNVANYVHSKWPQLKVVIWDDMLRQMSLNELQPLGSLVEPMVWVYTEDIYRFVSLQIGDKYAAAFPTAWTASAFKGAHGEALLVPPLKRHLENNLRWIALIHAEGSRFPQGIQGLALTGWQRYDHFAVLCELLPVALPSLALSLSSASRGYFEIDAKQNNLMSALTCVEQPQNPRAPRPWLNLNEESELAAFARCMFPGSTSLRYITRLDSTLVEVQQYLLNVRFKRGWLTDLNIRHNFSSPIRVDELIFDAGRHQSSLASLSRGAFDVFQDVYENSTIHEFVEQTISPFVRDLNVLEKSAQTLMGQRVWPRRPIPYAADDGKTATETVN